MSEIEKRRNEVIKFYGEVKGKLEWSRNLRPAVAILKWYNWDVERVKVLIKAVKNYCDINKLSWTLETVRKLGDRAMKEAPRERTETTGMQGLSELIKLYASKTLIK